jgi:hypothetical protein
MALQMMRGSWRAWSAAKEGSRHEETLLRRGSRQVVRGLDIVNITKGIE